jgi:hypothetical protein
MTAPMDHDNKIWTPAAYALLFERVPRNPKSRKRFLEAFAVVVGTSPKAVALRLRFGSRIPGEANWDSSHARIAIECLAAALQGGFIRHKDIPHLQAKNPKLPRSGAAYSDPKSPGKTDQRSRQKSSGAPSDPFGRAQPKPSDLDKTNRRRSLVTNPRDHD